MQSELSADSQDIVHELTTTLTRACGDTLPAFGETEQYTSAVFEAVRLELSQGGWNELLTHGAGGDEDSAIVARVVEAVALAAPVLAFPLAENTLARHIMLALGDDAAAGDGVVVADTSRVLGGAQESPVMFPYPKLADRFITLVPGPDADSYDVVAYESGQLQPTPQTVDSTRPLGTVAAGAQGASLGTVTRGQAERYAAEALLFAAAELLGTADRLTQQTREHLAEREQFGNKLSANQALRHRLADSFVQVETLRSLVWYAAWIADQAPQELPEYALLGKGFGAEIAWTIADESIQLFGGMGYTWELGLQFPAGRIASRALEAPTGPNSLELAGRLTVKRGSLVGLVA